MNGCGRPVIAMRAAAIRSAAGTILLEVVVATVLVGVLVTSLSTAFAGALANTRESRRHAETLTGSPLDGSMAARSWQWAPRVVDAWWRPGPVLHLRLAGFTPKTEEEAHVAFWADGWLVGDLAIQADQTGRPQPAGDLQVEPDVWTPLVDSELVIRVRGDGGVWGPPCRLAVPGPSGGAPTPGLLPSSLTPTAVVHRPATGTSPLAVSWQAADLTSPPFGLSFSLSPAVHGWGGVTLDGRSQWWWLEEGRDVDVYF